MLRRVLIEAARRLAGDPRVRAKAADLVDRDLKPSVRSAAARARPTLDAARNDIREATRASDPKTDPVGFAKQLKKRFIDDPR